MGDWPHQAEERKQTWIRTTRVVAFVGERLSDIMTKSKNTRTSHPLIRDILCSHCEVRPSTELDHASFRFWKIFNFNEKC
jgi:hypothetical protein